MAKNRKVKGFCGYCEDPVINGGRKFGDKWYHNPCYVAYTYGSPQDVKKGRKPRRSAPTRHEMTVRSEEGWNPIETSVSNFRGIPSDLEVLAHAHNVTFAANPPGDKSMFYIWQGPKDNARSIVRFQTYNQANQYYRDVIDGKVGFYKNPWRSSKATKITFAVVGIAAVAIIVYWFYKRRQDTVAKIKNFITSPPSESQGTGTVATDGFHGVG